MQCVRALAYAAAAGTVSSCVRAFQRVDFQLALEDTLLTNRVLNIMFT